MTLKIVQKLSPNFWSGWPKPPTTVVIHDTEGPYEVAVGWLCNPESDASAHYVVNEDGSEIKQLVLEKDRAWHTLYANDFAFGVEHAGYMAGTYQDSQLRTSAELVAGICYRWNIPVDRDHIKGHSEMPGNDHRDPGPNWPWANYITYVRQFYDELKGKQVQDSIVQNGYTIGHGFYQFWNSVNTDGTLTQSLKIFGLPLSDEYTDPDDKLITQVFERTVFKYHPEIADPAWQVQTLDLGRQWQTWLQQLQVKDALNTKLIAQLNDLQAQMKNRDNQIVGLNQTAAQARQDLASLQAKYDSLLRDFNAYKASHPDTPVTPPAQPVQFGNVSKAWDGGALWRPEIIPVDGPDIIKIVGETGSQTPQFALLETDTANKTAVDINDGPHVNGQWCRMAVRSDGTLFHAFRSQPPNKGYVGYLRVGYPGGTVDKGFFLTCTLGDIDQPDIALSADEQTLYVVGQLQTNPPQLVYGEMYYSQGDHTLHNLKILDGPRPAGSGDIMPRIVVSKNDNIYVVYLWGGGVRAAVRLNGTWATNNILSNNNAWNYRDIGGVAVARDGNAYAVGNSQKSVWLARFSPVTASWSFNDDALKGVRNPVYSDVTVTQDLRVWLALGYDYSVDGTGLEVVYSPDQGTSFSAPSTAIAHDRDSEVVRICPNPTDPTKVMALATFKNPRETLYAYSL